MRAMGRRKKREEDETTGAAYKPDSSRDAPSFLPSFQQTGSRFGNGAPEGNCRPLGLYWHGEGALAGWTVMSDHGMSISDLHHLQTG
jgi:hypothetical protein